MKQKFSIFIFITVIYMINLPSIQAATPAVNQFNKNVNLIIATATPTPTPSFLKLKTPLKEIAPLSSTSTPTPTISPTVTPTVTPTIEISETPTISSSASGENPATPTATAIEKEKTATPASSNRDPVVYGLIIGVLIYIIVQSQWGRIKTLFQKKSV